MDHVATLGSASASPGVRILHDSGRFMYEGGDTLTLDQVFMLDTQGHLDWASPEMRAWAHQLVTPVTPVAQAAPVVKKKLLAGLPTWAKIVGALLIVALLGSCCASIALLGSATDGAKKDTKVTEAPASAEETDTEVVPEPEPTPEPAPSPQPAALTAEERAYSTKVGTMSLTLAEAVLGLSDVLQNDSIGVMTGGDSQIEAAGYAGVIQSVYEQAKELTPPASMQAIHDKWLSALKDYNDSMDHLANGIDNVDTAEIEKAAALMTSGGTKTAEATQLLQEFAAGK